MQTRKWTKLHDCVWVNGNYFTLLANIETLSKQVIYLILLSSYISILVYAKANGYELCKKCSQCEFAHIEMATPINFTD